MRKIYAAFLILAGLAIDNANAQNTFPATGNVGIGISPAAYPLHVRNTDATNRARFHFGVGIIDLVTYSTGTFAYSNSSGLFVNQQDALVMAGSNKDIRFVTHPSDYTERMRIKANGNIGIGTTDPSNTQNWGKVMEIMGSSHAKLLVSSQTNAVKTIMFAHSAWNGGVAKGVVGTESDHDFAIHTGYSNERIRIKADGNVGIGTASPTHKLEVNGTIRAKEIKLEATSWPDYVFEDGYQLMPLEEVKVHIDQKGHLPGLKPAKEYGEQGVSMMELNQKLLEKIEELTLYQIELLSRIKLLESKSK